MSREMFFHATPRSDQSTCWPEIISWFSIFHHVICKSLTSDTSLGTRVNEMIFIVCFCGGRRGSTFVQEFCKCFLCELSHIGLFPHDFVLLFLLLLLSLYQCRWVLLVHASSPFTRRRCLVHFWRIWYSFDICWKCGHHWKVKIQTIDLWLALGSVQIRRLLLLLWLCFVLMHNWIAGETVMKACTLLHAEGRFELLHRIEVLHG